ncbi:3617_t:CDS:2 [Funneliformis mosseae]|uniref:3617_t:CDS:1 n=1 Tax=Funneliformis mosseae TaxID=27381 RepID=A0A9N8Z5I5_FUNMO|nr:3617_t:CDS:2 [Funneliformis mosseae]
MAFGRTKQNNKTASPRSATTGDTKIEKSSLEIVPISSHPSFNYFTYQKDDVTKHEQPYSPKTFENFDDKIGLPSSHPSHNYFASQRNSSFEQIQTIYDFKISLPPSHPSSNYLASQRNIDFEQLHFQIQNIYDCKASLKNLRYLKYFFSNDHLIRYTKSDHFNSLSEKIKRLINLLIYEILSDEFRRESVKLSQKLEEYIKRNLIPELPNGYNSYTEFENSKAFKFLSKMQRKRVKKLVRLENNMTPPKQVPKRQRNEMKSYNRSSNFAVKHGGLIVLCADDMKHLQDKVSIRKCYPFVQFQMAFVAKLGKPLKEMMERRSLTFIYISDIPNDKYESSLSSKDLNKLIRRQAKGSEGIRRTSVGQESKFEREIEQVPVMNNQRRIDSQSETIESLRDRIDELEIDSFIQNQNIKKLRQDFNKLKIKDIINKGKCDVKGHEKLVNDNGSIGSATSPLQISSTYSEDQGSIPKLVHQIQQSITRENISLRKSPIFKASLFNQSFEEFQRKDVTLSQKLNEYIERGVIPALPKGYSESNLFKKLNKILKERITKLIQIEKKLTTGKNEKF